MIAAGCDPLRQPSIPLATTIEPEKVSGARKGVRMILADIWRAGRWIVSHVLSDCYNTQRLVNRAPKSVTLALPRLNQAELSIHWS